MDLSFNNGQPTPDNTTGEAIETPVFVYPPKPLPEPPAGNSIVRFIVSIALFGLAYYFLVSKNIYLLVVIAVVLLIHELGHFFAMKLFRYQDLSIFFIPLLGAAASGTKENISQKEKAIVLLAGPLPGIIAGLVLFFIARNQQDGLQLLRLSYAFVLLNLFNLLPIYPLDGGQLLKTLFMRSNNTVSNIFILASAALLAWYAITRHLWALLLIDLFLLLRLVVQAQTRKLRQRLDELSISWQKNFSQLTDEEYWRIRDEALAINPRLSTDAAPQVYEVSQDENRIISYIQGVLKTTVHKDLSPAGVAIIIIVWVAAVVAPLWFMTRLWYVL